MLVYARPRLSLNVTFTLSAALSAQAQAHADALGQPLSYTLRNAVFEFLHDPTRFKSPNMAALARANVNNPAVTGLKRDRQLGFVLPTEEDHTRLHVYAQGLLLTRAAIIRRAVYEHTKDAYEYSDLPEIIFDAWGDRPMNPPEKRQKRKNRPAARRIPAPTASTSTPNTVRHIATGTRATGTEVDVEGFNEEFGKWMG